MSDVHISRIGTAVLIIAAMLIAFTGCEVDGEEKSSNAALDNLIVSQGELSPAFSSEVTSYTLSVGNEVDSITVTGTVADETAELSSVSGTEQSLTTGDNTITLTVTAEDGSIREYTVTVTREKSSNADLDNLIVSQGELSPAFSSDVTSYTVSVANEIDSITVTGSVFDETAELSSESGAAQSLSEGDNTITLTVTAEDGYSGPICQDSKSKKVI